MPQALIRIVLAIAVLSGSPEIFVPACAVSIALLAWHYVQATKRGQANINDYLAELVGRPVGTVRGHLIRARHDGILSGSHGKKGGELRADAQELVEPYALAWLDEFDRISGNTAQSRD